MSFKNKENLFEKEKQREVTQIDGLFSLVKLKKETDVTPFVNRRDFITSCDLLRSLNTGIISRNEISVQI